MTYSGNSYESHNYGIGCATSDSPMGPWSKYSHNPLLQQPGPLKGTGHNGLFYDREGKLKVVFHAHNSDTKIAPRRMLITDAYFQEIDGKNVFTIDKNYATPYLVSKVR
jgi:beta-xylosidase